MWRVKQFAKSRALLLARIYSTMGSFYSHQSTVCLVKLALYHPPTEPPKATGKKAALAGPSSPTSKAPTYNAKPLSPTSKAPTSNAESALKRQE